MLENPPSIDALHVLPLENGESSIWYTGITSLREGDLRCFQFFSAVLMLSLHPAILEATPKEKRI